MSATFETVLKQAKALPVTERRKLVEALKKPNSLKKTSAKKWDDDPVIKELRAWVDKIEKSNDPEIRKSLEIAERIREYNDRKFEI
ncbi:MAG: hypothetical protein IPL32_14040 [Chloracidobacterium sp.]|nr:hypothetical protein [Chloracidobacterium sp.]